VARDDVGQAEIRETTGREQRVVANVREELWQNAGDILQFRPSSSATESSTPPAQQRPNARHSMSCCSARRRSRAQHGGHVVPGHI
jgi:hypothetical protein